MFAMATMIVTISPMSRTALIGSVRAAALNVQQICALIKASSAMNMMTAETTLMKSTAFSQYALMTRSNADYIRAFRSLWNAMEPSIAMIIPTRRIVKVVTKMRSFVKCLSKYSGRSAFPRDINAIKSLIAAMVLMSPIAMLVAMLINFTAALTTAISSV
jgi:hypothetical protein